MELSDMAEEILETMWVHTVEEEKGHMELSVARGEPAIDELLKADYIKLAGEKLAFTEKGRGEGRAIVRRHRLAERLFTDILDIKKNLVHPVSCRFEHLLHEGIEENICILLGHPRTCPHGRAIPEGECCRKSREVIDKIISPLDKLKANQKGRVAYIHTKDPKRLQKLMAMGVLPGMTITLIQRFPSYVFQIGQSQFAVDKDLAEAIFIRLA
ncbi:MAG: hypothetical protein A2987_00660 [Omnitrophica bacterium RIFCSPLOWO2_01_FULL_45_10]|nr:MAG: hypothetical protein A2987_00660 [Omnitrophica bacterium RIFCSPLOWO2_01_FULL_45_10]